MIVTPRRGHRPGCQRGGLGGFLNTGQICLSIERVYVDEPVYDEFVASSAATSRACARAPTGERTRRRWAR